MAAAMEAPQQGDACAAACARVSGGGCPAAAAADGAPGGCVRLRDMREEDLPQVSAVIAEAFHAAAGVPPGGRGAFTGVDKGWRLFHAAAALVAVDARGAVVGCVFAMQLGPRFAYFGPLAVRPCSSGHGIGRMLASEAAARLRRGGAEHIEIVTYADSPKHIHLYESCAALQVGFPIHVLRRAADAGADAAYARAQRCGDACAAAAVCAAAERAAAAAGGGYRLIALTAPPPPGGAGAAALADVPRFCGAAVAAGLDLSCEARGALARRLGAVLLLLQPPPRRGAPAAEAGRRGAGGAGTAAGATAASAGSAQPPYSRGGSSRGCSSGGLGPQPPLPPPRLAGVAIVHGPGAAAPNEAAPGTSYLKFAAADAPPALRALLRAATAAAAAGGRGEVLAGVCLARRRAYEELLAAGFEPCSVNNISMSDRHPLAQFGPETYNRYDCLYISDLR
ncbi:hypothetical protein Rsub_00736 [Raphidocelis subcapitata]|uniref:N-acetyltransferase domain-containing protein n=1 Tax=Raphidocelis subcapitata TaxID=307507 RepID=A0A2V0NKX4_9CHLO|nr:hypothetical protein Rsub_00736 [Raphidocelis subcapitata]|eukprot:GBF88024.1 hypothetical protein Rsub_00736 [Raphidocelis subcapitata]